MHPSLPALRSGYQTGVTIDIVEHKGGPHQCKPPQTLPETEPPAGAAQLAGAAQQRLHRRRQRCAPQVLKPKPSPAMDPQLAGAAQQRRIWRR